MILVLALLIVLLFAGLGFTLHVLWIIAAVFLVLWVIGFALGAWRERREAPLLPLVGRSPRDHGRDEPHGVHAFSSKRDDRVGCEAPS